MKRRSALIAVPAFGSWTPLRAQAPLARHAALALVGDRIEVVVARMSTGSITNRNLRESWDDKAGSFDKIALGAMAAAFEKVNRGAALTLLSLPPGPLHQWGDELVDSRMARLPGNLLSVLQDARVERLLLLTKFRGEASIGSGRVRGIGFYLDAEYGAVDESRRLEASGLLAPFVYLRLYLIDVASQAVLGDATCRAMRVPDRRPGVTVTDPWDQLSANEKTAFLKAMLEDELARMVPKVIEAAR